MQVKRNKLLNGKMKHSGKGTICNGLFLFLFHKGGNQYMTSIAVTESETENIQETIRRYQKAIDPAIIHSLEDEILQYYYPKIYHYVGYITKSNKSRLDLREDAFQEACVLFLRMLKSYDEKRNEDPFLYAKHAIKRKVFQVMRMIDYGQNEYQWRIVCQINSLKSKLGTNHLDPAEVAKELNIKESTARKFIQLSTDSNYKIISELEEKGYSPVDTKQSDLHKNTLYQDLHTRVFKELHKLFDEEELYVLERVLGINGPKKTIPQIARDMLDQGKKITYKDVEKIYQKCLMKMRRNEKFMKLLIATKG